MLEILAGTTTVLLSNSARTTSGVFDTTEAGNWTYYGQSVVGALSARTCVAKSAITLSIGNGKRDVYHCRNCPHAAVPHRDSANPKVTPTLRACSASTALLMARSYPPGTARAAR